MPRVTARFGRRLRPLAWDKLDAVGRTRAAIAWHFGGRETAIDKLLAELDHRKVSVGKRELAWWTVGGDAGLLFDGERIVGHAVQFGFVCYELPLWKALAMATSAPSMFSWELEEGGDEADADEWKPFDVYRVGDIAALIRDAEASRRRS